jgi:hypothetical protein
VGDDHANRESIELISRISTINSAILVAINITLENGCYEVRSFYPIEVFLSNRSKEFLSNIRYKDTIPKGKRLFICGVYLKKLSGVYLKKLRLRFFGALMREHTLPGCPPPDLFANKLLCLQRLPFPAPEEAVLTSNFVPELFSLLVCHKHQPLSRISLTTARS